MRSQIPFHASVEAQYSSDRLLFERMLRAFFAVGGTLWILVFIVPFGSPEDSATFRLHQYQLYVALLSLWGIQARRDLRRLRCLVIRAAELQSGVGSVEWSQLDSATDQANFTVLRRRGSASSFWALALTWGFFIAAVWIIVKQVYLIFN